MTRSSAQCLADDVIVALRVDGTPPDPSLADSALVTSCEMLRRKGRLGVKKYTAVLEPLLHKCLSRHPTGGNCLRCRATLFTLLNDVKPLDKKVLNRLRIVLLPGIDHEVPRILKELKIGASPSLVAPVPGWLRMEDA